MDLTPNVNDSGIASSRTWSGLSGDQQRERSLSHHPSASENTAPQQDSTSADPDLPHSKDLHDGPDRIMPDHNDTQSISPNDDTITSVPSSSDEISTLDSTELSPQNTSSPSSVESFATDSEIYWNHHGQANDSDSDAAATTEIENPPKTEVQFLQERIERLSLVNLELHQKIAEQKLQILQQEERLSNKPAIEPQQTEAQRMKTLQLYHIIPADNEKKPSWKSNLNGTRQGPLYNDIPNIYREATVETLLCRCTLNLMLEDFDTMIECAVMALERAEALDFSPLIARCHFAHGVALYHKGVLRKALQEFEKSFECSRLYEIPMEYIKLWCDACIETPPSTPGSISIDAAIADLTVGAFHRDTVTENIKMWGFPTAIFGSPSRQKKATPGSRAQETTVAGGTQSRGVSTTARGSLNPKRNLSKELESFGDMWSPESEKADVADWNARLGHVEGE